MGEEPVVSALPTVAILGRPNVGKSTLFNRLAGRRIAITEETPGITRDRVYAECEWRGKPFRLVDTGGLDFGREQMTAAIRQQVEFAIEEADVILFVVDAKEGPAGLDYEIAERLRRTGKPLIVVANKVESRGREEASRDFFALSLGEPVPVSAIHGMEIGTLLDRLEPMLPEAAAEPWEGVRVAIVGRPNVGKSSLLNALMGEDRAIVSPVPGTTRDAIDTPFRFEGENYVLIDTAGIRRKSHVHKAFEYFSVLRALHAIERCDVCVLVADAMEGGPTDQDQTILGYAGEQGRGQVLAVNKWDLRSAAIKETDTKRIARQERLLRSDFLAEVKRRLSFAPFAPVVFTSATEGLGLRELMEAVHAVAQQHSIRIPTAALNRVVREALAARSLSRKGKPLKIYYATQASTRPPTIVLFVNNPQLVHFSHQRYLENRIRGAFGLDLTPLRFVTRESAGKEPASLRKKE